MRSNGGLEVNPLLDAHFRAADLALECRCYRQVSLRLSGNPLSEHRGAQQIVREFGREIGSVFRKKVLRPFRNIFRITCGEGSKDIFELDGQGRSVLACVQGVMPPERLELARV